MQLEQWFYRDYVCEISRENEDDVSKLVYSVALKGIQGSITHPDLDPYGSGRREIVEKYIDIEMPHRSKFNMVGPLTDADVERLWKEKFGEGGNPA